MTQPITLMRGIVGSTAYGLDREGSDVDRLGIFAWPTEAFWHLGAMQDSIVQNEPYDMTQHEIAKYLHLALKCNPTILELMWLPLENMEILTPFGVELRAIRESFLSESYVRNAYGGYAKQQIQRLVRRNAEGKDGFSSDTKKRTAKHARHCFRLLEQGRELLEHERITVRVADPEQYWGFDDMSVPDIVKRFEDADLLFNQVSSSLPESPNFQRVDLFLYGVRHTLLGWDPSSALTSPSPLQV